MYKIENKVFFDKTVIMVLATRLLNSFAGIVSIYFIFKYLSIIDQAHYYTFINLIGFSVFFEFGISTLIIQYISHQASNIINKKNCESSGLLNVTSDLGLFISNILFLAIVISALILVAMTLIGWIVFKHSPELYLPWFSLTFLTAMNFISNTFLNIIEGTGKLVDVAKIRLNLTIFSVPVLWISLLLGYGVYSLSIQLLFSIFLICYWLREYYEAYFKYPLKKLGEVDFFKFLKSIFPLQARLSFSYLSNYTSLQAFVPIIFAMGYVDFSARLGVSLQLFNAINGFAITWINSKLALFGSHVASERLTELKIEFRNLLIVSFLVIITLLFIFWMGMLFMKASNSTYVSRLLPLHMMFLLSLAAIANHFYAALNTYLLSFKKDPLFSLNVIRFIFLVAGFVVLFFIREQNGFLYLLVISAVFISMFGSLYIFQRFHEQLDHGKN